MKALVFHGPHDLTVQDRPDPVPAAGEVLLRIVATGICGSDLHGYTGENGRRFPGQVMGHETVGRVLAVGSAVTDPPAVGAPVTVNPIMGCGTCSACRAGNAPWCPDRRVIGVEATYSAAFAELMVAPAANVVLLPEDLPIELGALVEPLAVGYHAATRGRVGPGRSVLVIGGGPIGQAAALGARRRGGQVVVSEPAAGRRALLADLGFEAVDAAVPDAAEQIWSVLGQRPDVVIDAVGVSATLAFALTVSAIGATVVLVGMGQPALDLAAYQVSTQERTLVGSFCYSATEFVDTAAWLATQAPTLARLVEARIPLAQAPSAFAALAAGTEPASKILVLSSPSK